MKPDTDAIRKSVRCLSLELLERVWSSAAPPIMELCNAFDAQAEENKRMREALNYYADVHWSMIRGGPGIQVAVDALKTDTEEGET